MRRVAYFCARALENLRARPWPTALTVATIGLAFLLLAGYLLVFQALTRAADAWGERLEVSAYLAGDLTDAAGRALAERVGSWPDVARVTYVSRAEAMVRFRAALGGQSALLEALPGNPLPASVEVALAPDRRTAGGLVDLAARLGAQAGVTDVEYGQEAATRLATLVAAVRVAGGAMAVLLGLVATLIVANTVRLALYARHEELDLLRLVGATEGFVRAPFLIEGVLQGTAGALLAVGTAAVAHRAARPALAALGDLVGPAARGFLDPFTIGLLVAGGAALGLVGSLLSVARWGTR